MHLNVLQFHKLNKLHQYIIIHALLNTNKNNNNKHVTLNTLLLFNNIHFSTIYIILYFIL